MIKLYQREACPHCTAIRKFMEARGASYQIVNVPKLGTERKEVLALAGVTSAEVPVLVDGDKVIQGSDAILAHLEAVLPDPGYGDPHYGFTKTLQGVSYADAIGLVKDALATQGFGVLTEIDVKATMRKKLDVDFQNYIILGACNPPLAYQAFTAEPGVGLLLPCNVVVTEDAQANAVVSAIDPMKLLTVAARPEMEPLAKQVSQKLRAALAALTA